MNNLLLSFVLSCFFLAILCKKDVIVKSVKIENIGEQIIAADVEIQKYNRSTYLINGKFQIFRTLDESLMMDVNVHIFKGSIKLTSVELVHGKPFCENIKKDIYIWKTLSESSGVAKECPIEAKEYIVENFRPNASLIPDAAPNGLYEFESLLFLDGKLQQKIIAIITVFDK